MTINLSRLCQAREPSGDGGAPCWTWLAGGLALGSLTSLGIGYYLGKRKEERAQQEREEKQQQAKEEDAKLHQRTVIPGDFKELNEEIVRLIRAEVCSLTEQLSQALEKKQALMMVKEAVEGCRNAEWGWWSKQLGMKSHVIKPSRHALLHHQINMDVCVGRIHELKKKIAELQSYLDRGEPVLRLSQDLENAPEVFTCPITFDVMESPVVAADGYTYEEGSIRKWLRTSRVSPKTNEDMHSTLLQPNNSLRLAIKSWRDEVHAVQSKTSRGLMTY